MWSIANELPAADVDLPAKKTIALIISALGGILAVGSIGTFIHAGTTVDPMNPEKAGQLVTIGVKRMLASLFGREYEEYCKRVRDGCNEHVCRTRRKRMRNTRTSLWRCTVLWYFLAVGMFFILCGGNAHAADSDEQITCSLSSEKRSFTTGDQITVQMNLANGSASAITVLVPEDPGLLLTWGVVKLALRNSKGALYTFVPLPAPFIPTVYEHYQKLQPRQKVTRTLNLCAFRDKENSQSPCSIQERFTIEAGYSADKDTYWDENKKQFEQISGVWKGAVSCGQVTIDTVD